ncbi:hypothetical protein [Streptomyces mashuensis]|nr:hypothetical protein [Streptomyces mashuensis]
MNHQVPQGPPPPAAPRRSGRNPVIVVLAVIIGLGYGAFKVFDHDKGGSRSTPSSSASAGHKGGEWQVGDCGGPDPDRAPDGYKPYDCGDSHASFKAVEIKDGTFMPESIQCPGGTDLIIRVSVSFGSKSSSGGGIPTKTVCGRNLAGNHPGDPGAGGGQLVKGDCVTSTAKEVPCSGAASDSYKVLDLVKNQNQCPAGTTEPMELTLAIGRPYDVICAAKQ